MKTVIVLVLLFIITVSSAETHLKVSLYYESLCPDSVRFVVKQLYPTYKSIGGYLNIDLIPFGFAEAANTSGSWTFTCQHGPRECYGNEVHSCVIVKNPEQMVEFVNCAMSGDSSDENHLQKCADNNGISWSSIQECLDSGLAADYLAENGKRTNAVNPKITWIPTIIFNDVYNKTLQELGEHHFLSTACMLLKNEPAGCSGF